MKTLKLLALWILTLQSFSNAYAIDEPTYEDIVGKQFKRAYDLTGNKADAAISFFLSSEMEFYRDERGNIVVGKQFIESLLSSEIAEDAILFSFLHEFRHNHQALGMPLQFSDIQSRKKLECEADASAAQILTDHALNSLVVTSSDKDIESVLRKIDTIKRIPLYLPSVTDKYFAHLTREEREFAVLFGVIFALGEFSQNDSNSLVSDKVGKYVYMDGVQTSSLTKLTLMDICSYVVRPEGVGALNRIFLFQNPDGTKKLLSEPFVLIRNEYELMGDTFKPIEYSYISLSGVKKIGAEKRPSNYLISGINIIKVVVSPGENVRFHELKKYFKYDTKKFSKLPNHALGSLDRAEFLTQSAKVASCFEKLRLKPTADDERALKVIITVAKDAGNDFGNVKRAHGSSGPVYDIDLSLPVILKGELYLTHMSKSAAFRFQVDEILFNDSLLDSFITYDKDQAITVFNRVADQIRNLCKKEIGFENPIKFEGEHEMVIESFTAGSSAKLEVSEGYEDERSYLDSTLENDIDSSAAPSGDKYYSVELSVSKKWKDY